VAGLAGKADLSGGRQGGIQLGPTATDASWAAPASWQGGDHGN